MQKKVPRLTIVDFYIFRIMGWLTKHVATSSMQNDSNAIHKVIKKNIYIYKIQ